MQMPKWNVYVKVVVKSKNKQTEIAVAIQRWGILLEFFCLHFSFFGARCTLKVYQQLYLQLCQELLAEHCLGQRKLLIAASR